jgi:hypothetical protein
MAGFAPGRVHFLEPRQLDAQFQQFPDLGIRFGFGVNSQNRFRAGTAQHEPRGILATNLTPSNVFIPATGERSNFFGGFSFKNSINDRALLQRKMRVNPSVTVRAKLFLQLRQHLVDGNARSRAFPAASNRRPCRRVRECAGKPMPPLSSAPSSTPPLSISAQIYLKPTPVSTSGRP